MLRDFWILDAVLEHVKSARPWAPAASSRRLDELSSERRELGIHAFDEGLALPSFPLAKGIRAAVGSRRTQKLRVGRIACHDGPVRATKAASAHEPSNVDDLSRPVENA